MSVAVGKDDGMARYMIIGYEEYPALNLHPVDDDHGVELPVQLYGRWLRARAALDVVQRDVIAYLRASGGRGAIPEELWEPQDHTDAVIAEGEGDRVHGHGELSARI
jgi:hypothetical protein